MSNNIKHIIDSNVAIVANGGSEHTTVECELACLSLLEKCRNISICVDVHGLIMDEYSKHLSFAGCPGIGDMFFKYLHDNQYADKMVHRIIITPIDDESRSFNELPQNKLDPSDRKFLATAVSGGGEIFNATDTDWEEQKVLMELLNVKVHQLSQK